MRQISPGEWRQVFALLDAALELRPGPRESWFATLNDQPAELKDALRQLLSAKTRHETSGFMQELPQFTVTPGNQLAEAADSLSPGGRVGPYRLLTRLGRGGMSSVWVAERTDGLLKRRVAVKLPHVHWALSDLAERMARERDILASLEHPNIARLYDAGIAEDGRPYLALELVDGKPIDEYCAGHNADIPTRVAIALQTAKAVAFAHSRKIVHRDLKPSNVLVDSTGQVRLLDFGISKLLEQDPALASQATQFGSHAFTPDYASPEQTRGETVTASTDIYSFGVVVYQLLSGSLPHASRGLGASAGDGVLRADPRPPSEVTHDRARAPALRGDLDTIVLKSLKDSVADRYPTMQAVTDDLERYLRGEPVLAQRDSAWYRLRKFSARNRFVLRAVAAAMAVTVAINAGLAIERSRQQSAETARAIEMSADAMARSGVPRTLPTADVVAYREYLQARGTMIRPTEENLREVLRLTQSAITRDPKFTQAYAVLAGANIMFLDHGYPRPEGLTLAETAVRQALALNPRHPGAHATLGAIAAHRGDWLGAEAWFKRAFEFDDGTGRIHARHAEAILNSTGRLREALRVFRSAWLLTPTHPRASMQVAVALGMQPENDREAMSYVDIAITNGWPNDAKDVQKFYAQIARRAGRQTDAADYEARTLPAAVRDVAGVETVRLLHQALAVPAGRPAAIASLDALNVPGAAAETNSFDMLMFSMNWYTRLGDLDHAYQLSERWLEEFGRTGRVGIPWVAQLWLPEMQPFRADRRFQEFARRLGLMDYWQEFGPPDSCELRRAALACR